MNFLYLQQNTMWFAGRLLPLGVLFVVVYGGTGLLAVGRPVLCLAFVWECHVPFVSAAIWVYLSIFVVFWVPLLLMERQTLRRLMGRYILVTLVAGMLFLLMPTAIAFELPAPLHLPAPYRVLQALLGRYNAAPSLHVAYAVLILGSCMSRQSRTVRCSLGVWLILIVLSTWLTYQHHLVDMLSGAVLGWLGNRGLSLAPRPGVA